ncbi:hypothetical protein BDC45DRAFT_588843 [Circinella umbellata]|nr:hypothetical protein BDC45DRAFT_588843 [Circinella umbellata]
MTQVTYLNNIVQPFYIICIYRPAQQSQQQSFYQEFSNIWSSFSPTTRRHTILLGDFNLQLHRQHQAPSTWRNILATELVDCITPSGGTPLPTFKSSRYCSCIDYIFRGSDLVTKRPDVFFLDSADWTDHCLLTTCIPLPIISGPGIWRFHPSYLSQDPFLEKLFYLFDVLEENSSSTPISPQEAWDALKAAVK